PPVIARPVALSARRPFALLGAQGLRHLRFEHLLQRRPHQRPQKLLVLPQKGFDVDRPRFTLTLGHGVHPRKGSGDYASPAYHDHPPQRLLQNFPDTTGWERWSRRWLYDTLGLFNGYRVRRDRPKVASA